ncbi:predicted protein [Naegleria gruberi]|uniref:Predicted protein n=1 Tax=Naegleria gruberi TaxID=5762 RepID=D2VZJ4_NAEGR|nr:uncharacterized protein NAEGRDRAFT_74509 [Naegleria gruberi]EFC37857.1 predicted protein [Naegleria gruberi]|eukprot:XP_002670601.1 predicted protein [Naegleria gruberi strain NEG-M]
MTTVVLNPEQFAQLSPLQIKVIAETAIKETPAKASNGSLPAENLSNKSEESLNAKEISTPTTKEEIKPADAELQIPSKSQITQPPPVIQKPTGKGQVIDVEGNNARSSYHLAILISIILAMFCMVPLAFIPFSVVYFRFRSNPTESPRVYAFSERCRWIAIGVLFSNVFMFLVAVMIVLIVLFSIGIFNR